MYTGLIRQDVMMQSGVGIVGRLAWPQMKDWDLLSLGLNNDNDWDSMHAQDICLCFGWCVSWTQWSHTNEPNYVILTQSHSYMSPLGWISKNKCQWKWPLKTYAHFLVVMDLFSFNLLVDDRFVYDCQLRKVATQ